MEHKPLSTGSIVGAVVLLLVAPLSLYVGGYFVLGKYETDPFGIQVHREYRYDWLAYVYRPLARVEMAVTGIKEMWVMSSAVGYRYSPGYAVHVRYFDP